MPNAYLPPQSKTNELFETSKVRLKLHLFPFSYPGLVL